MKALLHCCLTAVEHSSDILTLVPLSKTCSFSWEVFLSSKFWCFIVRLAVSLFSFIAYGLEGPFLSRDSSHHVLQFREIFLYFIDPLLSVNFFLFSNVFIQTLELLDWYSNFFFLFGFPCLLGDFLTFIFQVFYLTFNFFLLYHYYIFTSKRDFCSWTLKCFEIPFFLYTVCLYPPSYFLQVFGTYLCFRGPPQVSGDSNLSVLHWKFYVPWWVSFTVGFK